MGKVEEYTALVTDRKACRRCAGLVNPSDVELGALDSDHIGPWSRWQGNLDARLMVVGQDWGDIAYFVKNRGGDVARNFTNRALIELLAISGIAVEPFDAQKQKPAAFFTNAILCLKSGGLQGGVDSAWFRNCHYYLRRQIEIVCPRVVVGLGKRAFASILGKLSLSAASFRTEVEAKDGHLLPNGTRVFAVYHCGARVRNTHRSLEQQKNDWCRIRPYVEKPADGRAHPACR